jgi:hypothetical protein
MNANIIIRIPSSYSHSPRNWIIKRYALLMDMKNHAHIELIRACIDWKEFEHANSCAHAIHCIKLLMEEYKEMLAKEFNHLNDSGEQREMSESLSQNSPESLPINSNSNSQLPAFLRKQAH